MTTVRGYEIDLKTLNFHFVETISQPHDTEVTDSTLYRNSQVKVNLIKLYSTAKYYLTSHAN